MDHIYSALESIGLAGDHKTFEFLSAKSRLALCLDGFDEVKADARVKLIQQIEQLAAKYDALRLVITSRPDNGIDRSPYFRVLRLAPLAPADVQAVIEKLTNDPAMSEEIRVGIDKRKRVIAELLTTPLMVTLLVMSYKNEKEIPETVAEFYEALFSTLLVRHDKLKPTWRRPRKSNLSDEQFRKLFDAICFLARKKQLPVLPSATLDSICARAKELTQVGCDARDFIEDITRITCLLIEEGDNFHYIHKSVSEFHAASFIRAAPDSQAAKFYKAARGSHGSNWYQELDFLEKMDAYRLYKFYLLPEVSSLIPTAKSSAASDLYFRAVVSWLRGARIQMTKDGNVRSFFYGAHWPQSWIAKKVDNKLFLTIVGLNWGALVSRYGSVIRETSLVGRSVFTHEIRLADIVDGQGSMQRAQLLSAAKEASSVLKKLFNDAEVSVKTTDEGSAEFDDL